MKTSKLILASSSIYRQEQLRRAGYKFDISIPNIDESRQQGESTKDLALRLAHEKAKKTLSLHPNALVVGADQVCAFNEHALGKPRTVENAIRLLQQLSGQSVTFHSAVAVLSSTESTVFSVPTVVELRKLSLY